MTTCKTIALSLLTAAFAASAGGALGQQRSAKEQIVGAWEQVSVTLERPDGTKFDPWGGKLKGLTIYTADGYFSQHNTRTDVPKFASGNRQQGTPEEVKAAYAGSYAHFGTYTVDEANRTLTVRIQASSFPNEIGTEQKRPFTLTGDQLTFTNPSPPSGGKGAVNVLKRVH